MAVNLIPSLPPPRHSPSAFIITSGEHIMVHGARFQNAAPESTSNMSLHVSLCRGPSDNKLPCPKASGSSQAQKKSFKNATKVTKHCPRAKKHHLRFLGPLQDASTTTSSNTISPLLRLPGEIRNLIYLHALTSPTSTLIYNTSKMRFQTGDIGFGLLSSCHALALETQYLHLKLNTLVFALGDGESLSNKDMTTVCRGLGRLASTKGWKFHMEIAVGDGETAQIAMLVRSCKSQ